VGGGVGNAFFYVGADEVLVIDAKISAEAAGQMFAEIKKVTEKPVRRVVLTHSDGDHVNGLAGFPPHLTIISHANARQDMVRANAAAAAKLPLPNETLSKELTVFVGDTEVELLYFGPAHTNGDVVVYIPSEKAAIVGDLVFVGRDPLIHANKCGSSFGLVSVLKAVTRLDADVFLSGHADGVDKKTIEALVAQIEQKQAKVKALIQEGKTLAEVKKAFAIADQPAGGGGRRWPSLVEVIYRELTEKE
jgi:glyoxylase-like metal-dependent hydrolase (beta-lactamase superfamily II)